MVGCCPAAAWPLGLGSIATAGKPVGQPQSVLAPSDAAAGRMETRQQLADWLACTKFLGQSCQSSIGIATVIRLRREVWAEYWWAVALSAGIGGVAGLDSAASRKVVAGTKIFGAGGL